MLFMHAALLSLVSLFSVVQASTPVIRAPVNGTKIAPGAHFNFSYHSIADYTASSYMFTVVLFTEPPSSFTNSFNYASGYTFGQFDVGNYPVVSKPEHPAPKTLKMPDFSVSFGHGAGACISNATFYLAVIEEYTTGVPSVGHRFNLVVNEIVYNATEERLADDSDAFIGSSGRFSLNEEAYDIAAGSSGFHL